MFFLNLKMAKRFAKPGQLKTIASDIEASCQIVFVTSTPPSLPAKHPHCRVAPSKHPSHPPNHSSLPPNHSSLPPNHSSLPPNHSSLPPNHSSLQPNQYYIAKMVQGHHGVGTWTQKPPYATYKSPYGPNYRIGRNWHGISVNRAMKFGITAASFGVVGGIFALQFFSEVPKVRIDIMQKIPFLGKYFDRQTPPEDSPF